MRTYSPDPLAAEDWAIVYRRWLGNNENQLRDLFGTLAKDENGKILVRKANDDPAPGKGFEWGMLHYARVPIDVYRVSLVLSHSPDGPDQSDGYFVYADGTFRWDSIVPFAKPGTYQSDPGTSNGSQTHAAGSAQYPNTPGGLHQFLSELRAAQRNGDPAKVDAMIKQTEIPEYRNWFCSVYIPGSGLSWAIPYGNNLAQNERSFKAMWERLAQIDGEIRVRKLVDKPDGNRGAEWGMIHNSRTPLDIYSVAWKSGSGAPDEWIGYFIYIDGTFRLQDSARRVAVTRVPAEISPSSIQSSQAQPQPGGIIAGGLIHKEDPKYPKEARKQKLQGRVLLQVTVEENGIISIVSFISGEPTLANAALNVVHKWKFEPFTQNGHALRVQQKLVLNFAPGNKVAELELPLPAPTPFQTASGPGVYRVGGAVSAPRALFSPNPEYPDEARRAKYQGVCVLSLIVGQDGLPRDIKVARSLGMGLDENAIEAVKRWRFQPALKDGKPVPVFITIEVQFRTNDK